MARKKKRRGAVIQPTGGNSAYDNFKLKRRVGNIVPLPTKSHTRAHQIQESTPNLVTHPKLHATPRRRLHTKPNATVGHPTSTPPPLCTALALQPAPTSIDSIAFVPVVIDLWVENAKTLYDKLNATAGITIKTLGLGKRYDLTIQDNGPAKRTVTRLVELAFILTDAPYVVLLRQRPTGDNWLANALQSAMDNRSPVTVVELAPSGLFGESSLILERSIFITKSNVLNQAFWKRMQRVTLA